MQYLATNVRQDLGFHQPSDIRDAFEGVWLVVSTWSSMLSCGNFFIFFHILKRNISKNKAIPPKFSAEWRPSKWQKMVELGSKIGIFFAFWGVFSCGYLDQYFFFGYYDLAEALEQSLEWKFFFWKFCENHHIFRYFCLKNLQCAVNGSESLINGISC